MAQFEYVDKLFPEGFKQDVEFLKRELPVLEAEMTALAKSGLAVYNALGSTRTLKDMVDNTAKAAEVNTRAAKSVKELSVAYYEETIRIQQLNAENKLSAQIATAKEGSIAKEILLVKQLTAERNKLNLSNEKERQQSEDLKRTIDQRNAWIKESVDSLSAQKINVGNYPQLAEQFAKIKQEMQEMTAAGQQGTQMYADMEGKLSEISRAMGPTSAHLTSLTNTMTLLASAGKQDTQEFKDLQQQAMALRVNMNYVKTAISGTTDAANKNSAAMHSSGRATFAVSQVLREMPSFAYSTSTGILALSNNIPMLGDAIGDLKRKNEELVASGQKAIPVWKSLGLAVFSVNGIITLAVTAITILSARMAMAGNEAKGAAKNVDSLTDSLTNLHNIIDKRSVSAAIAIDTELIKSQRLIEVYKNQNTVAAGRINAYNDLQAAYPKILSVLTDEELRHKKISAAHESEISRLNDYIKVKVQIAEKDKELNASVQLRDEALSKARSMYSIQRRKELGIEFRNAFGNQAYPDLSKIRNDDERAYFELLRTVRIEEARITRLKEEQVTSAVQLANIENVKPVKDKKSPKGRTLDNENDLTDAIYDEYVKRMQISAEAQKVISDDETKSLEQRLMAYRQYAELSFDAETVRQVGHLEVINNSLIKIEAIEAKSADKRTQQEKELLEKKKLLIQQKQNISAEYDLKEVQHIEKTAQAIIAIQQNEVTKRLDAIKSLTNNVELVESASLIDLQQKWKDGAISYKDYIFEKKAIEDKFQKEKYQQIVDYLQLEINALAAVGVDTRRMQDALNAALKHLYDADLKNFEDSQKARIAASEKTKDMLIQLQGEIINTGAEFVDGYYQKQIAYEENLLAAIQQRRQTETDAINNTLQSEEKKQKQIQALNAQTAQQEKQIQAEIRRMKREQAIADRVASVLRVAGNTAVAITKAVSESPKTGGLPWSAIAAAIGAVQTAAIFAQPLPQYAEGTEDHPGGHALVGEAGKEAIVEPGKAPYIVDRPTILNLRRHARVIPEKDLVAAGMGFLTPGLLQQINVGGGDMREVKQAIDNSTKSITQAITNKPETQFIASNGEFKKIVKRGNNHYEYLTDNFA